MRSRYAVLQIALLTLGLAMVAIGAARSEAQEIFNKAIIICMECIGIG